MRDHDGYSVDSAIIRRLFRNITVFVASASAILLVSLLFLLASRTSAGAIILAVAETTAIGCCLATIALLPRQPVSIAVAPMLTGLFTVVTLYALIIPPLTSLAAAGLALVIIFVASLGSRRLTRRVAVVVVVTALLVSIFAPMLHLGFDAGLLLSQVQVVGPSIVVGMFWSGIDWLLLARNEAVALASQRAVEAEQSRAEAEQSRAEIEARVNEQARLLDLIQTLELPVLKIGRATLAVPLIGRLDSRRLEGIRRAVLAEVGQQRTETVVFDLTGITDVDTEVVHSLIETAQAVQLLGTRPVLSGVKPPVAQSLVAIGFDLRRFQVVSTLQEALGGEVA